MTGSGRPVGAALLLGLAACQPVIYDLVGGAMSEGTGTTGQGPMSMSEPTSGPTSGIVGSTGPGETGMSGCPMMACGEPGCPPCPPDHACDKPEQCESMQCVDGKCAPPECDSPADCQAGPCRSAMCDPKTRTCAYTDLDGVSCDDGDLCVASATCQQGTCVETPVDCSGLDGDCRVGICNPANGNCGVEFINEGGACDDGASCTVLDACAQGQCVGEEFAALYLEDFEGAPAWTLDAPWQIGPAEASTCAEVGGRDPAEDHSPGSDDRLAGAAIGGCLPESQQPMDPCMTSATFDTNVPGPVFLVFWSRMPSMSPPVRAEVLSGQQQWEQVYQSQGQEESGWTKHIAEISFFKSKGTRVRFCQHLPSPGQPKVAGWSVDDVMVGSPMCPPP